MEKVPYAELNSKQRENYNYHKVAAVLAEYGFTSMRLSSDWQGADFIAQHIDGTTFMKVQLKSRFCIDRKYIGKDLHICFPWHNDWYLYPHDEVMTHLIGTSNVGNTGAWMDDGHYNFKDLSREHSQYMEQFKL